MWNKAAAETAVSEDAADMPSPDAADGATVSRCGKTWAMLIMRVYEVDPLCCPECGGRMKVVSFIDPPLGGSRSGQPDRMVHAYTELEDAGREHEGWLWPAHRNGV